jgi:hypothetical protein
MTAGYSGERDVFQETDVRRGRHVNPGHWVRDEVADSLRSFHERTLATAARQAEVAKLARPSEEERRSITRGYELIAQAVGVDPQEVRTQLREYAMDKSARIKDQIVSTVGGPLDFEHTPPLREQAMGNLARGPLEFEHAPPPPPDDPNFWWHSTDDFNLGASEFTPRWVDGEGLHFTGMITHHSGDFRWGSFGAVAVFELQPNRIPPSAWAWRSSPYVELFGAVSGYTGEDDIFTGDLWAKCSMHLKQALLQPTLGGMLIRAEAMGSWTLFEEDSMSRKVTFHMPGIWQMPEVTLTKANLSTTDSLFAHLEVRFDFHVEGHGSSVWLDPRVLIRTWQWPLIPL